MARFFSDEDFPFKTVLRLRGLGHAGTSVTTIP